MGPIPIRVTGAKAMSAQSDLAGALQRTSEAGSASAEARGPANRHGLSRSRGADIGLRRASKPGGCTGLKTQTTRFDPVALHGAVIPANPGRLTLLCIFAGATTGMIAWQCQPLV